MGIAHVQTPAGGVANSSATSVALAFGSNVGAGNAILGAWRYGNSGRTVTLSDNQSNTYTSSAVAATDSTDNSTVGVGFALNCAGAATTVTFGISGAAANLRFSISEFSGVATSSALDKTAGASGSGTAPATSSVTPTTNGQLFFAIAHMAGTTTFTAGTDFTLATTVPTGAGAQRLGAEYFIQATAAAHVFDFASSSSHTWSIAGVTLKAAGGAPTLTAEQGSYALTGQAAALRAGRLLAAAQGTYNLTGHAAGLALGRKVAAAQGSYALTGNAAALVAARRLAAGQGSYALNGQDVTLLYDSSDAQLVAEAGSYALSGQAANLRAARTLLAAAGSYALTGQAARLARDARLVLEAGGYTLTGQAAALAAPSKLAADVGVYTLTGQPALLIYTALAGEGLADPRSRLPSEWTDPPAPRPRNWEPFDLSYFRWKYARERARVDVVELAPPAAVQFKRSVEDRELEILEDIEALEAELDRFERANARQRRVIGDVEAAIAQVQAVLEEALAARARRQEELALILIVINLMVPPGSRRA